MDEAPAVTGPARKVGLKVNVDRGRGVRVREIVLVKDAPVKDAPVKDAPVKVVRVKAVLVVMDLPVRVVRAAVDRVAATPISIRSSV